MMIAKRFDNHADLFISGSTKRGGLVGATAAPMRPTYDQSWGPVVTLPYVRNLSEAVR